MSQRHNALNPSLIESSSQKRWKLLLSVVFLLAMLSLFNAKASAGTLAYQGDLFRNGGYCKVYVATGSERYSSSSRRCPSGYKKLIDQGLTWICEACPPGSYSSGGTTGVCQLCPSGKYTPYRGASYCMSCPSGTVASHTGNSSCGRCQVNRVPNPWKTSCVSCGANKYASKSQTSCLQAVWYQRPTYWYAQFSDPFVPKTFYFRHRSNTSQYVSLNSSGMVVSGSRVLFGAVKSSYGFKIKIMSGRYAGKYLYFDGSRLRASTQGSQFTLEPSIFRVDLRKDMEFNWRVHTGSSKRQYFRFGSQTGAALTATPNINIYESLFTIIVES
ncbi:MAG: hypothetical protein EP343_09485 [Deltaproteobacteria bacterium]|nr:MAG: hypothetical protein EP343_09485 [Deltaproteobacteria bacterium]